MKRAMAIGFVVVVLMVAVVLPVFAQENRPIYYVKTSYTGQCQDGSMQCPYKNLDAAIEAGKQQVCVNNQFEVHVWNDAQGAYVRQEVVTGTKPLPPGGIPLSRSAVILMIALLGGLFVLLALRMRRASTR